MNIDFDKWVTIDGINEVNYMRDFIVKDSFNFALFEIAQEMRVSDFVEVEEAEIILQRGDIFATCEMIDKYTYSINIVYYSTHFDENYCTNYVDKFDFDFVAKVTSFQIGVFIRELIAQIEVKTRAYLFSNFCII